MAGTLRGIDADHHIDEPRPDRPDQATTASAVFGAVGVMFAFLFVQVAAFVTVGNVDIEDGIDAAGALRLVGVQLLGIAGVALFVGMRVTSWRRLGAVGVPAGSMAAGLRLLAPVALVVIAPTLALTLYDGDGLVHERVTAASAAALVVLAIAISVNEELWFRGLVIDQLERGGRPWLTVFGGAVLFGLPHVAATSASWLNAAAVTLAVAIPFTIVRLHCGSLWPLVVVHALIDVWAFLHTASVVPQGTPSTGELVAALVVPAVLAAGYALWWRGRGLRRITP